MMVRTWTCDDCNDSGCRSCWPAPDMKELVDGKIAEIQQRSAEESVEEGFALACYLNEQRSWGSPGKWNVHFYGEPCKGADVSLGSITMAILFPTRKAAVDFSKKQPRDDGPFRIVHVRRFPRPAPIFLGHSPIDIFDALVEVVE